MGFEELRELLRTLLTDLAEETDATVRARRTSEEFAAQQEVSAELSRMRREALEELVAQGLTHQQIADRIGVARARVGQLLASGPKPERAMLGTGTLTIAIGSKPEAHPQTASPSSMISEESSRTYEILSKTARVYGLDATQEIVRQSQLVNMNRPNLIVIGSPRILPVVGQALAADDNLGFHDDSHGWYLTEGSTIYRSPCDKGEPADYAYIGRLPRPDTKGTFLYLAGIHAMGTVGAAKFLTDNLSELYSIVRNKRWSTLIESQYDPDTRHVTSTQRITQIYR